MLACFIITGIVNCLIFAKFFAYCNKQNEIIKETVQELIDIEKEIDLLIQRKNSNGINLSEM